MKIFEGPEFFTILEGKDLEGRVCSSCNQPFEGIDAHGYQSKIDYCDFLSKDEIYHLECLRNYIFPVINAVD